MSWISDVDQLTPGAWVSSRYPGHGATGAEVIAATASGQDGEGTLAGDFDPGDEAKEFRTVVTVRPASGDLEIDELGSYSHSNAADGTWPWQRTLYVDGVAIGNAIEVSQVGAVAPDTDPATLSAPSAAATGIQTGTCSITVNELGMLYRLVDGNAGAAGATVKASGTQTAVTAVGPQLSQIAGLSGGGTYYVHWVHIDLAGNESAVATAGPFTTPTKSAGTGTPLVGLTAKGELILILGLI